MLTRTVSELDSHYLVLTISPGEKDYQIPMLLSNPVHGILPVHLQEPDGMCELWYEITSLRPVSEVFRAKKITPEEMLRIFLSVSDTVSELERFLLRSSGIQLNPELIYQNDAEEIFFCYSPAQGISSQENLGLLARFIVDHIDYADRETTRLAYDLFQESMKETVSLQDFLRIAGECVQFCTARLQDAPWNKIVHGDKLRISHGRRGAVFHSHNGHFSFTSFPREVLSTF